MCSTVETTADNGPIALATPFEPRANAIAQAVIIHKYAEDSQRLQSHGLRDYKFLNVGERQTK